MTAFIHEGFQHAFTGALLDADIAWLSSTFTASAARSNAGLAVYRNNLVLGLRRALAARFPTVARILGEEAFFAVASRFVLQHPPRSPLMMAYGEDFPGFLRAIGRAKSAGFLSEIAEIESARTRAHHSADTEPVSREVFADLGGALAGACIRLHPSVTLHRFATPAVSGWQANQPGSDMCLHDWRGEEAMIARARLDVGVWNLPPGAYDFLLSLATGATVAQAASVAANACDRFDLAEILALMIASEIVVAIGQAQTLE